MGRLESPEGLFGQGVVYPQNIQNNFLHLIEVRVVDSGRWTGAGLCQLILLMVVT